MYAGCVSGAIQKDIYLDYIKAAGFENIQIQKEKAIHIPDDILKKYLDENEMESFKNGSTGIFSITVFAEKEGISEQNKEVVTEQNTTCQPGSGCC